MFFAHTPLELQLIVVHGSAFIRSVISFYFAEEEAL